VVTPNIPATANFQSSDPKAQSAQAQVSGQLALASSQSSVAAGYLAPFQQGNWGNQSGGCWTYAASGGQGCTFRYEVCEISSGYEWLWTYDGSCSGQTFDDWVGVRGTTDTEGRTGTLRVYQLNGTTVTYAMTWETAADGNSGAWIYYSGDVSANDLLAELTWSTAAGLTSVIWEVPDASRSVLSINSAGTAGSLDTFIWNETALDWVLVQEIDWANGSGTWITYSNGEPVTNDSW
jgi:hypothetical protein